MLVELMLEIERLKEAEALLHRIYAELGPHQEEGEISEDTWDDVVSYMRFDDSE